MSKNTVASLCLKSFRNIFFPHFEKPSYLHKGQFGRIAVVGGCVSYPGAAYFAAIGGYNMGVDLVHVFCDQETTAVLRTLSPDLLVTDFFSTETNTVRNRDRIDSLLRTLDCVVLGCGAGTSDVVKEIMALVIDFTRKNSLPLVCDADVFRIPETLQLLANHPQCILTPNVYELSLTESKLHENFQEKKFNTENMYLGLWDSTISSSWDGQRKKYYEELIQRGYNVINYLNIPLMVIKGCNDVIVTKTSAILTEKVGSVRRCGGQGDLLAGSIGGMLGFLRRQLIDSGVDKSDTPLFVPQFDKNGADKCESLEGIFSKSQLSAAL